MRGDAHLKSDACRALEDRALADTREKLSQWGTWVRSGGASVRGLGKPSQTDSATITDDEALRVDRAVAQLYRRRKLVGRAVRMYYLSPYMNHRVLAKALRISLSSTHGLLSAGEHWIDARLHLDADA